ncbi:MAG: hypothetical protein KDA32_09720 [Phycisphaerales bacterium]|nr:hypothetical protein [Phycisphaerales bacterium]
MNATLTSRVEPPRRGVVHWTARCVWLTLAVGHIPALLGAYAAIPGDASALPRFLFLLATLALFALKVADAPWLRVSLNNRAKTRFAIIVALLHADVAHRELTGSSLLDQPAQTVAWVTTTGFVAWRLLTRRTVDRRSHEPASNPSRAGVVPPRIGDVVDLKLRLIARSLSLHRDPPEPA